MEGRRFGSYTLLKRLGRGGMGDVWRAKHDLLGRDAAVKLIRPETLGDGDQAMIALRRFEREAQATSGLRSPHTIEVYDYGFADDGTFYYAMELLEGLDLKSLVQRYGPVESGRAIYLLQQVCDSLLEAHEAGLIHRDIKPANIFACRLGANYDFVKVLDFGLVKYADGSGTDVSQLTDTGSAPGSPGFMPPEVARGDTAVDQRADIYAIGCVAYWLLTNSLVFVRDTPIQVLLAHVSDSPVPPSRRTELELPQALESLVLTCLAKAPEDRPQTVRGLRDALEAVPVERRWTKSRAERWWSTHQPTSDVSTSASDGLGLEPTLDRSVPERSAPTPTEPEFKPVLLPREEISDLREDTLGVLRDHFAHSQLNVNELSRRTELVTHARTPDELWQLVQDLPEVKTDPRGVRLADCCLEPEEPEEAEDPPDALASELAQDVEPETDQPLALASPEEIQQPAGEETDLVAKPKGQLIPIRGEMRRHIAIFSGIHRRGRWYPAAQTRVIAVFGGVVLDFRTAVLQPGCTEVTVTAFLGGCEIIVPPGIFVDVTGTGVLGAFDTSKLDMAEPPTDTETPWIRVAGLAFLGGVDIKTRSERAKSKRKKRRPRPRLIWEDDDYDDVDR